MNSANQSPTHSYRQEDVREILDIAVAKHSHIGTELSYDQLLEIAQELSITPDLIEFAQSQWLDRQKVIQKNRAFQAYRRSKRLCRKNDLRTGNPPQFLFLIGQLQKFETRILSVLVHRLCQQPQPVQCVRIFIASNPLMVRRAVLNEPNPIPGFVSLLINLWYCSTRLFKYFTCRSWVISGSWSSAFRSSTAGGYAAFLSTLITLGI